MGWLPWVIPIARSTSLQYFRAFQPTFSPLSNLQALLDPPLHHSRLSPTNSTETEPLPQLILALDCVLSILLAG